MKKFMILALLLTGCATSWPATKGDQLALVSLARSTDDLDRAIAPIITDARTRASVINYLWQRFESVEQAKQALLDEVAARHGVRSVRFDLATTSWVGTR